MLELTVDADRFRRDGFAVVSGALAPSSVEGLRNALDDARAQAIAVGGGQVLFDPGRVVPAVRDLLTAPPTLAIARRLVGDRVMELHQSAVHFGTVNRGWHKDCADYMQGKTDGPDWSADYRIVHLAFYLQDHVDHGGGISFRLGSQWMRSDQEGKVVTPSIRSGDIVVFDLRTTHYGNTMQLRTSHRGLFLDRLWRLPKPWSRFTPWTLASATVRRLPSVFLPEHGAARCVVFAMYGADDGHTRRFFQWMRTQPDLAHVWDYGGPSLLT